MLETANDIYGSDEKLINNEMYFKENLSFYRRNAVLTDAV